MCTNSFTRAPVKKRVLIITLCVQKTERVTRNLCSGTPQHDAPDGVAGRRSRGAVDREDCASKGSSIAPGVTSPPLRIEGQLFSDAPPRLGYARAFAALETENPSSILTRCVPPSTASIKKSSTCSKTLASLQKLPKNLPRSLRFRALKTVRDQNWWAA